MGQGLDRLLSGRMSLWELGAIIHGWRERQPKDDAPPPLELEEEDLPGAEAWAQAGALADRVVQQADKGDKA